MHDVTNVAFLNIEYQLASQSKHVNAKQLGCHVGFPITQVMHFLNKFV